MLVQVNLKHQPGIKLCPEYMCRIREEKLPGIVDSTYCLVSDPKREGAATAIFIDPENAFIGHLRTILTPKINMALPVFEKPPNGITSAIVRFAKVVRKPFQWGAILNIPLSVETHNNP